MKRDITPEAEAARLCRLRDEKGFTAFKWRVGAECGRDVDEWPGRTEAVIPIVAKALGEGIDTLVSSSQQNVSTITLNLRLNADADRAVTDV
jgi:L-alanine-DL-glutamate epimerase-like enolase superfamily enzyme